MNKDLSNSIIYGIRSIDDKETILYVGSTTHYENRQQKHKKNIYDKSHYNALLYKYIKTNGGFKNFEFVELDKFEDGKPTNKFELLKAERKYFDLHKPKLNTQTPYSSPRCVEYEKEQKRIEINLLLMRIISLMNKLLEEFKD